jgi:hemolysin D
MSKIIRFNAVETSSQSGSSGIGFRDLYPESSLDSRVVFETQKNVNSTDDWSACLEAMLEEPPSVVPYQVLLGGVTLFSVCGLWAWIGTIEEVSRARGKFVSLGEAHKLKSSDLAKVTNVTVKQGDYVKSGQVVAELDRDDLASSVKQKQAQLAIAGSKLSQLNALMEQTRLTVQSHVAMALAKEKAIETELAATKASLKVNDGVSREKLVSYKNESPFYPIMESDEKFTTSLKHSHKPVNSAEVKRLKNLLAKTTATRRSLQLEQRRQIEKLTQTIALERKKMADTEILLASAKAKKEQRFLVAPTDGVVASLDFTRNNEEIQRGQTIAKIVPKDAPLALETTIAKEKVDFIEVGMLVQLQFKKDSFFEERRIPGKVISISEETKPNQKYSARHRVIVELVSDAIKDYKNSSFFKPGQTTTAEIIVSHRTMDIFLENIKPLHKGRLNLAS